MPRGDLGMPGLCMWVRAMETYDRVAKVGRHSNSKNYLGWLVMKLILDFYDPVFLLDTFTMKYIPNFLIV